MGTHHRLVAVSTLLLLGGCAGFSRWPWGTAQRWPGPMEPLSDPLPPGDAELYPEGPEEVLILRHADPVQVRPAGLSSSYPLTFYDKVQRVRSGSAVYSAPGGRAEVLWQDGSSIVIYGSGSGIVGSPSRGESSFILQQVERATIDLKKEGEIALLGGGRLTGHSGPFVLDHSRADILRVKNQSKAAGRIAFRDVVFVLDPGQVIDLPLLSAGGTPRESALGQAEIKGPGFLVRYWGEVEVEGDPSGIRARAVGEHEIEGLGVRVRLTPGEEVQFEGLGGEPPQPSAAAPEAAPTQEPGGSG
jgi:hypothetical protein